MSRDAGHKCSPTVRRFVIGLLEIRLEHGATQLVAGFNYFLKVLFHPINEDQQQRCVHVRVFKDFANNHSLISVRDNMVRRDVETSPLTTQRSRTPLVP